MKTSCISHPENEPMIIIRKWQIKFCDGDYCAAALLSFFEYWHNIKLEQSRKNRQINDMAEKHGEKRTQDEGLIQFHNLQDLSEKILGLYNVKNIQNSLNYLESKGVIEIIKNPNPKYKFDKTNHFIFHPETLSKWLIQYRQKGRSDMVKIPDRSGKNAIRSGKNTTAIPEITTEIYINNTHTDYSGTSNEDANNGKKDCVCVSSASLSPEDRAVVDKLKAWFSHDLIDKLLSKYSASYVNEKITLTLNAKPKNPAGFLSRALQENWKDTSNLAFEQQTEEEPEWAKEQRREYAELLKQEYLNRSDIADWEKQWALDWEKKYGYFPDPEIERILKVGAYAKKPVKKIKN